MVARMFECPWTTGRLKRLSRHIRDGTSAPTDVPDYREVMVWYNDIAAQVQRDITRLDWVPLLNGRPIEVTSRAKTIDTLRQKLLRDRSTPLPSVQDVAGVRFEAEMSLDEQDAVAQAIAGFYAQPNGCIKDLRQEPHSGYRAVHVWLRLPVRVEVQVRTHLQGAWANAYEAAADTIGREIRYGVLPKDPAERQIVEGLQEVSVVHIAEAERARNTLALDLLRLEELTRTGFRREVRRQRAMVDRAWDNLLKDESEVKRQLALIHDQFRAIRAKR